MAKRTRSRGKDAGKKAAGGGADGASEFDPFSAPTVVSQMTAAEIDAARRAVQKAMQREKPTRFEEQCRVRWEKEQRAKQRWDTFVGITQKEWSMMSGVSPSQLVQQARIYGLPIGGGVINLPQFLRSFHEFISDNAYALRTAKSRRRGGEEGEGGGTEAGAALIDKLKAEKIQIEIDALRRKLVPVADVRQVFTLFAARMRRSMEELEREYGSPASFIVQQVLTEVDMHLEEALLNPRQAVMVGGAKAEEQKPPPPDIGAEDEEVEEEEEADDGRH